MHNRIRDTWARMRGGAALTAALAIGGAGLAVTLANPALAAGCPVNASCGQATVHVAVGIQYAFTSTTSFTLTPNVKDTGALTFSVSTNNPHGYNITISGTDPTTSGGGNFPATSLVYDTFSGGVPVNSSGNGGNLDLQLTNAAAQFFNSTQPTAGTSFSQDWIANLSGNQAPGDYQSTLSFVASVNP